MLDCRTKLCIIYDDSVTQTDYSQQAADFCDGTFDIQLDTNKYLYIGFSKPIRYVYTYLQTFNTAGENLVLEYYNGSAYVPLSICDDTNNLGESSIINWDPQSDAQNDTVLGQTKCFVRLSATGPMDTITVKGINILFSDDSDIQVEFPAILRDCYYPEGETDFIKYHITARNYIMQRLRSLGYVNTSGDLDSNITEFDVLDIFELRQASLYYAMSQIFFTLSDNVDDQYFQKYETYQRRFEEAMALGALRIDQNGDGQVNEGEIRAVKTVRWVR